MKIQYVLIVLFFASLTAFQVGCKKEKAPSFLSADCPDTVFYETQIRTLLDLNCATSGCHASGAGGITLLTHAQVSAQAEDVLAVIRHEPGRPQMPQGQAKLPDSIANQVACWINQGKRNN